MAVDKRVVVGGAALGVLGLLAFANAGESTEAAKPEPTAPPKPMTDKQRAIAWAVKYMRTFGAPPSLILAVMAVGGWNPRGNVANSRGGALGWTFITLATAADLTKRYPTLARKWWPKFTGSAASLMDPETNIALGAYHMARQWNAFKKWTVSALSYYTGYGRMSKLLHDNGGKLPGSTMPADVQKMFAAFQRVRNNDTVVKQAVVQDGAAAVGSDPLIWTAAMISNEMARIRIVLDAVNTDVSAAAAKKPPILTHAEWLNWEDFYKSAHAYVTRDQGGWGGAVAQARNLEQTALTWRTLIQSKGGQVFGPDQGRKESGPKDYSTLIKGAIAVGVLVGGASLVNAVRK